MPIYDLSCERCGRIEEVILLAGETEPAYCAACGGSLRRRVSRFAVMGPESQAPTAHRSAGASCGHAVGCRCSVRLTEPNPFADRLVAPGANGPAAGGHEA